MCVISIYETNLPEIDALRSMEAVNGDGGGMAWVDKKTNKVRWEKGLKAEEIMANIRKYDIHAPLVIHFRIATVGGAVKELCHPFPVNPKVSLATSGEADAVLFHNGHWHDWKEMCMRTVVSNKIRFPTGRWSDSRGMAFLASIYGRGFLNLIEGANKITVLTKNGVTKFGEGWSKVGSAECSNEHWKNRQRITNYNNGHYRNDDDYDYGTTRGNSSSVHSSKAEDEIEEQLKSDEFAEYKKMYTDAVNGTEEENDILERYM